MTSLVKVVVLSTFLIVGVLTWLVRRMALAKGMLDLPNGRSSHSAPVPRGGGLAIVIGALSGMMTLCFLGVVDLKLALALIVGGLPIAIIGFLDDRYSVAPRLRFLVHACSASFALFVLGGIPDIQVGSSLVSLGNVGYVIGVVAIVWALNLFNFMDGIDGIAASEAIFICLAGSLLGSAGFQLSSPSAAGLLIAAASLGFLCWNWPPAKIFMGDVGSGYLGYMIAVLALAAARENPVALLIWLTLGGVFFVDATVTLLRRLLRGEKVYEAHCTHAYQRLARRWKSHLHVTLLVLFINVFLLLPMAWFCLSFPSEAWWISIVALAPLAILALVADAGHSE